MYRRPDSCAGAGRGPTRPRAIGSAPARVRGASRPCAWRSPNAGRSGRSSALPRPRARAPSGTDPTAPRGMRRRAPAVVGVRTSAPVRRPARHGDRIGRAVFVAGPQRLLANVVDGELGRDEEGQGAQVLDALVFGSEVQAQGGFLGEIGGGLPAAHAPREKREQRLPVLLEPFGNEIALLHVPGSGPGGKGPARQPDRVRVPCRSRIMIRGRLSIRDATNCRSGGKCRGHRGQRTIRGDARRKMLGFATSPQPTVLGTYLTAG